VAMMNKDEQIMLLESMAGIFIRCFFLTIALLFLWVVFFFLLGDWAYYLHSRWFELSSQAYDLLFYYGMALIKTCAFIFFLFPYIAIKLVLRKIIKS
jgi:hypothetical protein